MKNKNIFLSLFGAVACAIGVGVALKGQTVVAPVEAAGVELTEEKVTVTEAHLYQVTAGSRWKIIIWFGGAETPDYDDISKGTVVDTNGKAVKPVNTYKYAEYMTINGQPVTAWSGWTNRCEFRRNSAGVEQFAFDLAYVPTAEDKIVLGKGMQFPSYNYVMNGVETDVKAYVLDRSYVLTVGSAGTDLRPIAETYIETAVDQVKFQSVAHGTRKFDGYMQMHLTVNDYPTVSEGDNVYKKGFNLWNAAYTSKIGNTSNVKGNTQVQIKDSAGNLVTIANDYGQELMIYKGDAHKGCFAFRMLSFYDANNLANYPSTVTIKKGTKFISAEYLASSSTIPHYFVTTEDVVYDLVKGTALPSIVLGNKTLVEAFNTNELKMDTIPTSEVGTGLCVTEGWYAAAKAKYNTFNANDKALFNANYTDAAARLSAWATANGEVFSEGAFSSNAISNIANSNLTVIIALVASLSVLGFASLTYLKKRKLHK